MASTLTTLLKLFKATPGTNEQFRTTDINSNMDKIDQNIGAFICTSTTRPAVPFQTQRIYETDTKKTYFWDGTTWQRILVYGVDIVNGVTTGSTDANGQLRYPHGFGVTPIGVMAVPHFVNDSINNVLQFAVSQDSTNIIITTNRHDTGIRFSGQPIPFTVMAIRP